MASRLRSGCGALRRTASSDRLAAGVAPAPTPTSLAPPLAAGRHRLALHFRGHGLGVGVPGEMWGAVALAARFTQPPASQAALPRSPSVIAQAFSSSAASSAAAAAPPPPGTVSEDHPKALAEALAWRPQLGAAEDAACLLGPAAICAGVYAATAPATVQPLYAAGMALLYSLLVALARTWLMERQFKAVQRSERELAGADSRFFQRDGVHLHYKQRTPQRQGGSGAGSGADISRGEQAAPVAVHCLHGFGASAYSWSFVQQELADALGATVTAHDMPGFGLSQRPGSSSYYTLHFNGDVARAIMDAELAAAHQPGGQVAQQGPAPQQSAGVATAADADQHGWRSHPIATPSPSSSSLDGLGDGGDCQTASPSAAAAAAASPPDNSQQQQQAQQQQQQAKRVLIGHSMGGAAAAEGIINNADGVAALVLVAPAIVALWLGPPVEAAGDTMATGLAVVEELVSADDAPGELRRLTSTPSTAELLRRSASDGGSSGSDSNGSGANGGSGGSNGSSTSTGVGARVQRLARAGVAVARALLFLAARLLLSALAPLLTLLLRRLVRDRRFWERGLRSAWHDGQKVTREYVDAYRSGQLVRGWENGILRFLAARFDEKQHGFWGSLREAVQGAGHLTQAERLARVVRRNGIRVLIVHGASDALVPAANSRRLAALLHNAELVEFPTCGHMPQEECPELFVETVQRFVAGLEEQPGCPQAA